MSEEAGFAAGSLADLAFSLLGRALIMAGQRHRASRSFLIGVFLLAMTIRYAFSVVIYAALSARL